METFIYGIVCKLLAMTSRWSDDNLIIEMLAAMEARMGSRRHR